ncbi:lipoprotein [Prevotella copri]|uniref:Type IV secretion system putative lipoprotein virB7 n=1 Tax=Segatella copri TaxID=165179 RepID=A0AAW4NDE3_9BACT|nr:BACON domain-containing carbohydrate-binding protein [Segatella copri]MBU9911758.1 lipoprotein [Segatella copri]MBV3399473.1 lipoprotein [Segatella copri]MBV3409040.1 lipoprotein [Segatella copri]MBV3411912.1 lipoprotein [Segatella copri]MBV3420409.1 lipoprotein [Segatella copri]
MKKIISLLVALLTLAACSDTLNEGSNPSNKNGVEDGGITLTINLPDFTKEKLTRAGEKGLTSLNAVAYDNDKNCLLNQKITSWEVVSDGYKVKVPVTDKTTMIHLVANDGDLSDTQCQSGLDKAAISGTINTENPVCWGMISVSNLMKANPEISLLRQFAKVNVKYEKTTSSDFKDDNTFELESFQVYEAADKGTIAPKDFDYNAAAVNVPDDASKANSGWQTGETPFYETAAGQAYLIVKGKYNSVESYYKVAFLDNKTKDAMPLLRNHAYTVKITHVNTYGWPTEAEAIKDPYPENRMMVDVKDDNPLVNDMIACKDYHLGVSDQVSGAWNDENIIATVVTTIKNNEKPTFSKSDDWIKGVTVSETITVPDTDGPNSTTGKKYKISIAVDKNEYSEEPRPGTVIVKSGDLTRTITVTQKGKDFKRSDRPVKLVTSSNVGTSEEYNNYFNKFLPDTKGIRPKDMLKDFVRNDGLHFGVGTNEFSYLIPKKTSDKVTMGASSDKFTVTDNGDGNWKVTLNSGADNYDIWIGDFTITYQESGHNIAITYPVYHCGIFHKIDASNQQPPDDQSSVSGRFYYGVVKVKGNSKTYVMLDRNLGASSDRCYAPGTKALEANKGAIGGYFHIATAKQDQANAGNLIGNLPQGFTIPENSVFQDIIDGGNLKEETRYTLSGEAYNSVEITTDNSELPVIYLPATGYVEGEAFRNVTHVSLWTRTLLSGNQGFDTTSPEYGFWYRYLDVYGKICTMSNLRFVSGNAGKNTGTYRAMPIRLVHVL